MKIKTRSGMPLTASRLPEVGDKVEVCGAGDIVSCEVEHRRGQFVWLSAGHLRFHVKDDLISTEGPGGDTWRIAANGATVRFPR